MRLHRNATGIQYTFLHTLSQHATSLSLSPPSILLFLSFSYTFSYWVSVTISYSLIHDLFTSLTPALTLLHSLTLFHFHPRPHPLTPPANQQTYPTLSLSFC
jgi:hypothetical protein